jgi:hypothetical protein
VTTVDPVTEQGPDTWAKVTSPVPEPPLAVKVVLSPYVREFVVTSKSSVCAAFAKSTAVSKELLLK